MGLIIGHCLMISLVVILGVVAFAGAASPAVLVHQAVVSRPPIGVQTGFDIEYTIINIADQAATNIVVSDLDSTDHDPLPESVEGHGGRVQFRAHIVPTQAGIYKPVPIKVEYVVGDQAGSVLSTPVDPVTILSADDYHRATEKFVKEYLVFAGVAAFMTIMPALQIARDYFFYTHGCPNALLAPFQRKQK